VPENLLDHLSLVPFDEGDFELSPASRTAKRIRFVHLLDERRPAFADLSCRGGAGGNPRSGTRRRLPLGPLQAEISGELPVGRIGLSSVEAPRGESHHFVVTGENNRPRRWRVRAPTYQNLQGIPAMIRDQELADMTISFGSIDPCFSCTDRLEIVDLRSGAYL
jgi:hypothetical protein